MNKNIKIILFIVIMFLAFSFSSVSARCKCYYKGDNGEKLSFDIIGANDIDLSSTTFENITAWSDSSKKPTEKYAFTFADNQCPSWVFPYLVANPTQIVPGTVAPTLPDYYAISGSEGFRPTYAKSGLIALARESIKEDDSRYNSDICENMKAEPEEPSEEVKSECVSILGTTGNPDSPAYWVQLIISIMRYIAIIALVIMITIDFIQALIKQDSDALKQATNKSIKRIIYAILIFFIPWLIKFLLGLFGIIEGNDCVIN